MSDIIIKNKMISVVVTIYNKEQYLKKCIDSLVNQTLRGLELILVDDGSTDGSGKICDEYAKKYKNIRVIHQDNEGLISARISGVNISSGDWIGFVDSDDYVEPEMYYELYNTCLNCQCDLISSGIVRNYEDGRESETVFDNYNEGLYMDNLEEDIYPSMLFNFDLNDFGLYSTLVNKLFRKEVLKKILAAMDTDISYGEDSAILYSYCMDIKSIYIMHGAFYHYCIRQGSMCLSKNPALIQNTYRLFRVLEGKFKDSPCRYALMKQLKRYVLELETHTLEYMYGINHGLFRIWTFSYDSRIFKRKYIIYGAAACGQALYRYIRSIDMEHNLVAWVDRNFEEMTGQCDYPVLPVGEGLKKEHDIVIIAVKNKSLAGAIKTELTARYREKEDAVVWGEVSEKSFFSEALH
jgi:glycosyltransferase involved in cell wall biosynthesis